MWPPAPAQSRVVSPCAHIIWVCVAVFGSKTAIQPPEYTCMAAMQHALGETNGVEIMNAVRQM